MNRRTLIFTLAITLAITSCSKKTLQVSPLSDAKYTGRELVYSLPRNVLNVKVEVTKTTYIPGPYAAFAKKLLGISNAIQEELDEYAISDIQISKTTESDPNALYVANSKKNSALVYFDIARSGLILPVDNFVKTPISSKNIGDQQSANFTFTDLTSTPFIGEEKSVYYSKVTKDSSFVQVPVQKKMIVERSMEEKAKEAAEYIFSLRRKRAEFFATDLENQLDGVALKAIFSEIDRIENAYLLLFIGKTVRQKQTRYFSFTPTKPEGESTILFRYSATKGIVGATDFSGNPVLLELKPEAIPELYSSIAQVLASIGEKKRSEYIYYRIPISTSISITDGKNEFIAQRELIYQYGMSCMIPLSQLKKVDE